MNPERNEPCSCGSGKKYKNCCAIKRKTRKTWIGRATVLVIALGVAGALVLAFTYRPQVNQVDDPRPWEYNPQTNQHWNPLPGHQHWHDGLPPRNAQTPAAEPPKPWEYDSVTNRHWDPVAAEWKPGSRIQVDEPEAFEYDAENDRHWDPTTRQWRPGLPASE